MLYFTEFSGVHMQNINFEAGNSGGKLLVISRILTVQRLAMCCGARLHPDMDAMREGMV